MNDTSPDVMRTCAIRMFLFVTVSFEMRSICHEMSFYRRHFTILVGCVMHFVVVVVFRHSLPNLIGFISIQPLCPVKFYDLTIEVFIKKKKMRNELPHGML